MVEGKKMMKEHGKKHERYERWVGSCKKSRRLEHGTQCAGRQDRLSIRCVGGKRFLSIDWQDVC